MKLVEKMIRNIGVTERLRLLNPGKANTVAVAICPIIVHSLAYVAH